jgi:hypothetical protein
MKLARCFPTLRLDVWLMRWNDAVLKRLSRPTEISVFHNLPFLFDDEQKNVPLTEPDGVYRVVDLDMNDGGHDGFWKRCAALVTWSPAPDRSSFGAVLAPLGGRVEHRHDYPDHPNYRSSGRLQRHRWRPILRNRILWRWRARTRHSCAAYLAFDGTYLGKAPR